MKPIIAIAAIAVVLLGAGVFMFLHKPSSATARQGNLAALQKLRDTGVLTQQEYDSKVQALQASVAGMAEKIHSLKELRDTGVITAQEYDAKVQALQHTAPASTPAPPPTAAPEAAAPAASSAPAPHPRRRRTSPQPTPR